MLNDTEFEFESQTHELHDYRNGKERPWREKKEQNTVYAEYLAMLRYLKMSRVSKCADVLRFAITDTGHLKLKQTWFCKSRLCPMCAWRRSMKYAVDTSKIIEEAVKREPKGRWLFLTLTTKNTTNANDLSNEIKSYSVALRKMLRSKPLKDTVLGFSRGIEVTVNKENGTYNQHMHVLLFVKASYFKGGRYISKTEWVQLWRKAMKLDYDPSVDVRAVKGANSDERFKAVLEVAKYPVKSKDYLVRDDKESLDTNLKIVNDLENALHRKRLTAFGGLLKVIQKELNIEEIDSDKADLIATGEEVEKEEETGRELVATWSHTHKNYFY